MKYVKRNRRAKDSCGEAPCQTQKLVCLLLYISLRLLGPFGFTIRIERRDWLATCRTVDGLKNPKGFYPNISLVSELSISFLYLIVFETLHANYTIKVRVRWWADFRLAEVFGSVSIEMT